MSRRITKISSQMDSEDEDDVLEKTQFERQTGSFGGASSASKGGGSNNAADKLKKLLPEGYDDFRILSASTKVENNMESIYGWFRLPLATKEDVTIWLQKFQEKTSTTYKPIFSWERGAGNLFKRKFICDYVPEQSSQRPEPCPACLIFSIKDLRVVETDPDYYLRAQPAQVVIHFNHNHSVPKPKTITRTTVDLPVLFKKYFENYHSPTSALICHKCDLHSLFGPNFYAELPKPSVYPSYSWCTNFYESLLGKKYYEPKGREIFNMLTRKIDRKCTIFSDIREFLAICTPLMKNVFRLLFNEEVISVRSIKYHKKNRKILVFFSHTPIGVLPFGVLIILQDDIEAVANAIRALLLLLEAPDFYPKTIIVDEDLVTSISLNKVFDMSRIIFNEFRMLQVIWRNVRRGCKDNEEDYQAIYEAFLLGLQSNSEGVFNRRLQTIDMLTKSYPGLKTFLEDFRTDAQHYVEYLKPQVHVNEEVLSYTDSGTMILMDVCTKYSESFNVFQLYDFIFKQFNTHYERKLESITRGKLEGFYKTFFFVPLKETEGFTCDRVNESEFRISFASQVFYVNTELDACTCHYSAMGSSCIHQYVLEKKLDLQPECYTPLDDHMMSIFTEILSYKNDTKRQVSCNDDKTAEIAQILTNMSDEGRNSKLINSKVIETNDASTVVEQFQQQITRGEELFTQYKVMENGMLAMVTEDEDFSKQISTTPAKSEMLEDFEDDNMALSKISDVNKITVLSSVVIQPSRENRDDKLILESLKGSANIEINEINDSGLTDDNLEVEEMDSDGVDELASQTDDFRTSESILHSIPKGVTVHKSTVGKEIVNTAVNQLTDLAKNNKCDVENFLGKLKDPEAKEKIATAIESIGSNDQPTGNTDYEFSSDIDEDEEEFQHYSNCPSSCSDFHSELEELSEIYDEPFTDYNSEFADSEEEAMASKPIPTRMDDMPSLANLPKPQPKKKKLVKHNVPQMNVYEDTSDEEYENKMQQQLAAKQSQLKRFEMASGVSLISRSSGSFDRLKSSPKRKQDTKKDLKKLQSILMDGDSPDSFSSPLISEDDGPVPLEKNTELAHLFKDKRIEMLIEDEEPEEYLYETRLSDFEVETPHEEPPKSPVKTEQKEPQKYFLVGNTVMAFKASKGPNKGVNVRPSIKPKSLKKPEFGKAQVNGSVNKTANKEKVQLSPTKKSVKLESGSTKKAKIESIATIEDEDDFESQITSYRIEVKSDRHKFSKKSPKSEINDAPKAKDEKKKSKMIDKKDTLRVKPIHELKENKMSKLKTKNSFTTIVKTVGDEKTTPTIKLKNDESHTNKHKTKSPLRNEKLTSTDTPKLKTKSEKLTPKLKTKTLEEKPTPKHTKSEIIKRKIENALKDKKMNKPDRRNETEATPTMTDTPVKRKPGRPRKDEQIIRKPSPAKPTISKTRSSITKEKTLSQGSEFEKFLQKISKTDKKRKRDSTESDDSEIIPVTKPAKKRKSRKREKLELLVLLERNLKIEMMVKKHVREQKKRPIKRSKIVPSVKTNPLKTGRRKGRGLEELLARARSSKFLY